MLANDIERDIFVSALVRPLPRSEKQTVKDRATRAWELVLEFREPQKDRSDQWADALRELTG